MTVPATALQLAAGSFDRTPQRLEVRLRLRNDADRALHYIATVRALDFDATTGRLTLRLHDEGREIIPRLVNLQPTFRFIDPGTEAELTLGLPAEVLRLAPSPDGDDRNVAFEKLRIADAAEIVVDIGWADVPFYEDARVRTQDTMPSLRWQQHVLSATVTSRPRRRRPR